MRISFRPEATEEVAQAARSCGSQSGRFLAALDRALAMIHDLPRAAQIWEGAEELSIRKLVLRGFPFSVAYVVQKDRILVLAVAHAKRRPLYWIERAIDRVKEAVARYRLAYASPRP